MRGTGASGKSRNTPGGLFAPPKAMFFYAVTSLRFFTDTPYRHVKRV
jgi:hypothetical protein